jgi:hypothetical protein
MQATLESGVFAAVTALIAKLGAVPLASHQIALNTVSLSYMVPLGISSAAAVRVGQALGRKDPARGGCRGRYRDLSRQPRRTYPIGLANLKYYRKTRRRLL